MVYHLRHKFPLHWKFYSIFFHSFCGHLKYIQNFIWCLSYGVEASLKQTKIKNQFTFLSSLPLPSRFSFHSWKAEGSMKQWRNIQRYHGGFSNLSPFLCIACSHFLSNTYFCLFKIKVGGYIDQLEFTTPWNVQRKLKIQIFQT